MNQPDFLTEKNAIKKQISELYRRLEELEKREFISQRYCIDLANRGYTVVLPRYLDDMKDFALSRIRLRMVINYVTTDPKDDYDYDTEATIARKNQHIWVHWLDIWKTMFNHDHFDDLRRVAKDLPPTTRRQAMPIRHPVGRVRDRKGLDFYVTDEIDVYVFFAKQPPPQMCTSYHVLTNDHVLKNHLFDGQFFRNPANLMQTVPYDPSIHLYLPIRPDADKEDDSINTTNF